MFMMLLPLGTPAFYSSSNLIRGFLFWNQNKMTEPGKRSIFVRCDSILGRDLLPRTWVKNRRIYLLLVRILKFTFLFFFIVIHHSIFKKLFLLLTTLKTKMHTLSLYLRLINLSSLNTPVSSKVLPPQLQWLLVRILFSSYYMLYFWDPELMRFLRYIQDPKLLA